MGKKRATCLIMSLVLVLGLMPLPAFAESSENLAAGASPALRSQSSVVASGTWGTCPWEISSDGVLTVYSGTGEQYEDYFSTWAEYSDLITSVRFDGHVMAPDCTMLFANLQNVVDIDLTGLDTTGVRSTRLMFSNCSSLQSLDLAALDTSNAYTMTDMFLRCSSLSAIDLSTLDTSNVVYMDEMLAGCSSLISFSFTGLDTSNVESMDMLFDGCSSLAELDLSALDTSKVKFNSSVSMFRGCTSLEKVTLGEGVVNLEELPNENAEGVSGWYSAADKKWYTAAEIAESRLGIFDTYTKTEPQSPTSGFEAALAVLDGKASALDAAEAELETAEEALNEARAAVADPDLPIKNMRDFFVHVGASDAVLALDEAYYSSSTDVAASYDATALSNVNKTFQFLRECNAIRVELGLNELLVTDTLMAIAESNLNWSDSTIEHSEQFGTGENLAWGPSDNPYEFDWDVYDKGSNPFEGWFDRERLIWLDAVDQDPSLEGLSAWEIYQRDPELFSDVGHYFSIIDPDYQYTGFAFSSDPANSVYQARAYGQVFTTTSVPYNYNDFDYGRFTSFTTSVAEPSYTVDQYEQRFVSTVNSANAAAAEAVQAAVAAAEQAYDAAAAAEESARVEFVEATRAARAEYEALSAVDRGTVGQDVANKLKAAEQRAGLDPVHVPGWQKIDGKWYYYETDATMATKKWQKDSKGWVYLGPDGAMVTNAWQKDSVGWCYLGSDGYAVKNQWKKDSAGWCYLDEKCRLTIGWKKISGKWYWFNDKGRMASEKWVKDSKGWVYLGKNGAMVTDKWVMDSVGWCYVGSDGYAVKSQWKKDSVGWCYLDEKCRLTIGWKDISGKRYWFDSDGRMATGTRVIDGVTYTFGDDGALVV